MPKIPPDLHHPLTPYLILWHTPGIGVTRYHKFIKHFPDICQLLEMPLIQLTKLGMPDNIAQALQTPPWHKIAQDLSWANNTNSDQHILTWQDHNYPLLLKEIPDPPPILYIKGNLDHLNVLQIAIIGSRKPTLEGIKTTQIFTRHLSKAGLTITSGLALGIDAASHQAALDTQGKTIAVLGTGIDKIYPACHKKLAEQILATGNTIISEFPLGTTPTAENFPRRNRIISGLSLGTLVIEATLRSGSLITARLANEQGRDVFAIPGSIRNPQTQGCHFLIQQGAKLAQTPQDILDELHTLQPTASPMGDYQGGERNLSLDLKNSLDANSQLLLECIRLTTLTALTTISVDELVERTSLPAHMVSSIALQLELQGLIVTAGGGYKIT